MQQLIVFAARRNDHITPLLHSLHWLRVAERITFRLAVLTYRCLLGSAPEYIPDIFVAVRFRRTYSPAPSLYFVF